MYSILECGRQTHGHIAVNMIYGHMDAKTQTYMEDIVRMNVMDIGRCTGIQIQKKKKTEIHVCRAGGLSYDRRTESQIDRVTSGRTDMLPLHSPRYAYASRGKNCGYVEWCRQNTNV